MSISRIDFSKLKLAQQKELFEEMAVSWPHIFNTPVSDLEAYLFEKRSRESIIYVRRESSGEISAILVFKFYEIKYENEVRLIVKIGVLSLPEVRGNSFTARCILSEAVRTVFRYPLREIYLFSTSIHPVSYAYYTRAIKNYYPSYTGPQDPAQEKFASFLAGYFQLERSPDGLPFVAWEKRFTLESDEDRAYWRRKQDPAVRFFLEHCPRYGEGQCFTILAPVPRAFLLQAVAGFGKEYIRRRFRRKNQPNPAMDAAAPAATGDQPENGGRPEV